PRDDSVDECRQTRRGLLDPLVAPAVDGAVHSDPAGDILAHGDFSELDACRRGVGDHDSGAETLRSTIWQDAANQRGASLSPGYDLPEDVAIRDVVKILVRAPAERLPSTRNSADVTSHAVPKIDERPGGHPAVDDVIERIRIPPTLHRSLRGELAQIACPTPDDAGVPSTGVQCSLRCRRVIRPAQETAIGRGDTATGRRRTDSDISEWLLRRHTTVPPTEG